MMTAVTIAPSTLSNVMVVSSQASAGVQIERRDGKGRHANSNKDYRRQALVGHDVAAQIAAGDTRIMGVMIESNLVAGRQDVLAGTALTYGQSITDGCIDWKTTVPALNLLADAVAARRDVLRRKFRERSA